MNLKHTLLTICLICLLAAPVAAASVTDASGKTYNTYDEIYASTTLSSAEKLALVQEMAGWTEELAAYMEWKNSGGLEAYQAAVSGGNSTSSDYGWDEAPGDGLGDSGMNIEPEYSYQERQAYDAAYAAYQAEFAENYAATAAYTGSGSGTQANPYIITTPAELQSMQDDLTAYYKLGNDIDLTGFSWSPVGSTSTPFSGNLDGNGYTISNLELINNGNSGIFGHISGAKILNVKLSSFTISFTDNSYSQVSFFAAGSGTATFENCMIINSQINGGRYVGGFVSLVTSGVVSISNCIIQNVDYTHYGVDSNEVNNVLCGYVDCYKGGLQYPILQLFRVILYIILITQLLLLVLLVLLITMH